jgi:hypothetical protein
MTPEQLVFQCMCRPNTWHWLGETRVALCHHCPSKFPDSWRLDPDTGVNWSEAPIESYQHVENVLARLRELLERVST